MSTSHFSQRIAGMVLAIYALTFSHLALAQDLTQDQILQIYTQASKLRIEAIQRLYNSCEVKSETIVVPDVVFPSASDVISGKAENVNTAGTKQIKLAVTGWTGGCAGGSRDGEGILTEFTEESYPGLGLRRHEVISSGLFVSGRKLGPWRVAQDSTLGFLEGAYILYALAEGYYLKQPDGSLRLAQQAYGANRLEIVETSGPMTPSQIGSMMAEVRDRWNGQIAGATDGVRAPVTTVESALLADLLQGRRATLATERNLGRAREKTLLVVLSNRTSVSLERMDEFRRIVSAWAGDQGNAAVRRASQDLLKSVDKNEFLEGVLVKLRERFKAVIVVDDLSSLKSHPGGVALVLDVAFEHRAQQFLQAQLADAARPWSEIIQRYSSASDRLYTYPPITVGVSYMFLNDKYEIVMSGLQNPQPVLASRAHEGYGGSSDERATVGLVDALGSSAVSIGRSLSHEQQVRIAGQSVQTNNMTNRMFEDVDKNRRR